MKTISAVLFVALLLYFTLSNREHVYKPAETIGVPLPANAGVMPDAHVVIKVERESPWKLSPFDVVSAPAPEAAVQAEEYAVRFMAPDVVAASLTLLCGVGHPDHSKDGSAPPLQGAGGVCPEIDSAQVRDAIRRMNIHAIGGDVEATLFLSQYWTSQHQRHRDKTSATNNATEANEGEEISNFDASSSDTAGEVPDSFVKFRDPAIEQELANVEQMLLKLSEAGAPEVLRELSLVHAYKEPSAINLEKMLAYQLASEMRHPAIMTTIPPAESLNALPNHIRSGVQRRTEEIIAKCCAK